MTTLQSIIEKSIQDMYKRIFDECIVRSSSDPELKNSDNVHLKEAMKSLQQFKVHMDSYIVGQLGLPVASIKPSKQPEILDPVIPKKCLIPKPQQKDQTIKLGPITETTLMNKFDISKNPFAISATNPFAISATQNHPPVSLFTDMFTHSKGQQTKRKSSGTSEESMNGLPHGMFNGSFNGMFNGSKNRPKITQGLFTCLDDKPVGKGLFGNYSSPKDELKIIKGLFTCLGDKTAETSPSEMTATKLKETSEKGVSLDESFATIKTGMKKDHNEEDINKDLSQAKVPQGVGEIGELSKKAILATFAGIKNEDTIMKISAGQLLQPSINLDISKNDEFSNDLSVQEDLSHFSDDESNVTMSTIAPHLLQQNLDMSGMTNDEDKLKFRAHKISLELMKRMSAAVVESFKSTSQTYYPSNYFHVGPRYQMITFLRDFCLAVQKSKTIAPELIPTNAGFVEIGKQILKFMQAKAHTIQQISTMYFSSNYFHVGPRREMFQIIHYLIGYVEKLRNHAAASGGM